MAEKSGKVLSDMEKSDDDEIVGDEQSYKFPDLSKYEKTEDDVPIGQFAMRPSLDQR